MRKIIAIPVCYRLTCPSCGCVFEYEEEDVDDMNISCPNCGCTTPHTQSQPIYEYNTQEEE